MAGRTLCTHAGSLPRPAALAERLASRYRGEAVDGAEIDELVAAAVPSVVAAQRDAGIDIANDGEQGRESFFTYVQHRMSGFGGMGDAPRIWQDVTDFPGYYAIRQAQRTGTPQVTLTRPPKAIGEVHYGDTDAIDAELARFDAAVAAAGRPFADTFITAPSPGIIVAAMRNAHYPNEDEYLAAVGAALAVEYRRVVDAGHLLQIDAPDLAMEHHGTFSGRPLAEFLGFVDRVIATINTALEGIAPERVRLHVCWGNYGGPHTHDVALDALIEHVYPARVGGLLLSMANPRHEHEYRDLVRHPLPAGWVLSAGVIDVTTNYVEHPEVVALRIERIVEAVGDPARVVAATDCGFDTAAGFGLVAGDVAWAKLASLRAGADLASSRLF